MVFKGIVLFAAVCAHSVLGSYYQGPTAIPHVLKSGYLADTHEVAAAKGAHLAALAKESHYGYAGDYSESYGGDYHSYGYGHDIKYHGPTAIPHVLKNGHIADTHEVAVAKAEHYAAVTKAKAHGGHGYAGDYGYGESYGYSQGGHGANDAYGHGHDFKYYGPTAIPHVLRNGHIADTHEVTAAKAEHYAAVSKAKAHRGYGHAGVYAYNQVNSFGHDNFHQRHQGVLPSGYLADTEDVQAARHHHVQALNNRHY